MHKQNNRLAGFTIVELVLVLILVSVMAGIITPVLRISPSRQVENVAHLLATRLELARSDALAERRQVRVDFDVAGGTYTAYADHDEDDVIGGIAAEMAAFTQFSGTIELGDLVSYGRGSASAVPGDAGTGAVTLAGNQVLMSDQGVPEPWGTMGTIYLVHDREATAVSAISVSSSGSFKVWRWNAGAWQ